MFGNTPKSFGASVNLFGFFKSLSKLLLMVTGCLVLASLTGCHDHHIPGLLDTKGTVAFQERKLFFDAFALMMIVVLPVIIMSITFAYHYQVSHRTPDYKPNWSHSYFLEAIWWGIPCVIIAILAVLTWVKSHELDPYKALPGKSEPPLVIQAIALPWKWVFIYPEQNIATVNYVEVPVGRDVEYWITADNAPMSAFFIPQLGSQIFAMAGMRTRLHLEAAEVGVYKGQDTQYNGSGFSDMHFPVHVVEQKEMDKWVSEIKKSPDHLTEAVYGELLNPSINNKAQFFAGVPKDLFNHVISVYMNSYGIVHPRENQKKFQAEE